MGIMHLLFQLLCKDVAREILKFGGKVNGVSNFEFLLANVFVRVEPQNVIRLTNGSENLKNLRDNKWPRSNTYIKISKCGNVVATDLANRVSVLTEQHTVFIKCLRVLV